MLRLFVFTTSALMCCALTEAQVLKKINPFDSIPEVDVRLTHPPRLGHQIQEIRKVAFAGTEGECADDFVDSLIADFVANGVEVTDRQNMQAILDEHEFTASGLVDRSSAQRLGNILGPAALISVKIRRCTTNQESFTNHRRTVVGQLRTEWISKTTAYLKGSIQVVDLSTSLYYSAQTIDETVERSNSSPSGPPEFPDRYSTIDAAMQRGVLRVHQMFFPWTERRRVRFYDDKDCGLKLAYNFVRAGDIESAIQQSKTNVNECAGYGQKKPKLVARALYNVGMAHCLANQFEPGLEALEASLRRRPHEPTSEAMAECKRAQEVALELKEFTEAGSELGAGGAGADRSVADELSQLESLYESELLTKEIYRKRAESIIKRRGVPGNTVEEKLRALKAYNDQGIISAGVYEEQVARVLGSL